MRTAKRTSPITPLLLVLALAAAACATVDPHDDGPNGDDASDTGTVDRERPDPTEDPVVDPSVDPETDPSADPAIDPGADPSADPSSDPVADPGGDPGGDTPADTSLDPDAAADPDRDAGPPCAADRECTGDTTTCVLYDTGSGELATECRAPEGAGGPGAECTAGAECASGQCLYEAYCLAPCETNEDCPEVDQVCQPLRFVLDDAGTFDVLTDDTVYDADVCLPDVGSLDPCVTIADCHVEGETCTVLFDELYGAERRCLPQLGTVEDGPCDDSTQCETAFCLSGGFCYWACASDTDCASGGDCTQLTFVDAPGDDPTARSCVPTCTSSEDCAATEVCQSFLDDDPPNTLVQLCDTAQGGSTNLESGAVCTPAAGECRSGDCYTYEELGENRCVGPCDPVTQAGCAADTVCYPNFIYYVFDHDTPSDYSDDTYDSIATCYPDIGSYDPCTRESDCSNGETCTISALNEDMTAFDARCMTPIGTGLHGATCTDDADCRSGWCASETCVGPCVDATDCTATSTTCDAVDITISRNPDTTDDDIVDQVDICW